MSASGNESFFMEKRMGRGRMSCDQWQFFEIPPRSSLGKHPNVGAPPLPNTNYFKAWKQTFGTSLPIFSAIDLETNLQNQKTSFQLRLCLDGTAQRSSVQLGVCRQAVFPSWSVPATPGTPNNSMLKRMTDPVPKMRELLCNTTNLRIAMGTEPLRTLRPFGFQAIALGTAERLTRAT